MCVLAWLLASSVPTAAAQDRARIGGRVTDETGAVLPGVRVELRTPGQPPIVTTTSGTGEYACEGLAPGTYQLTFIMPNFAPVVRRDVSIRGVTTRVDVALHMALSADVTVVGQQTFRNLADAEDPAANLVGIAQSASQGAITAQQLEDRPILRGGEVLETVPGLIVTQHSGEGKANQYFLRGFNLDHGSDFASTVAGTPVNMPTHAHSQGYSDLNFLVPELVAGVQFSKGPYYADQGDFATAGASTIAYITEVERPRVQVEAGGYGYGRVFGVASPKIGRGRLLVAGEISTNSGPWSVPDAFHKVNTVLRYSRGTAVSGLTLTFMGYRGTWNATEASPERAIVSGLIDRFGSVDTSDGGRSSRSSLAFEWQRGAGATVTKVSAYALDYRLDLFSNFTFYLDDPERGDQREQVDRRLVTGARVSRRHAGQVAGHAVESVVGVQFRSDRIPTVALYHTEARRRLETLSDNDVTSSTLGAYAEATVDWSSWLRTTGGLRVDAFQARVAALSPLNSGRASAGIVSPKGTVTMGPWRSSDIYLNAGTGFHSNSALGAVLYVDPQGLPTEPVTPLVRATGGEIGVRTVVVPHLQTTVSWWLLRLGSELVYDGDVGATEPGPASRRHGVEIANYYRPRPWLVLDLDTSLSSAHFATGEVVPEAVGTVVSAGVSIEHVRRLSGSLRWRYFGSRNLDEEGSVRSRPTSLLNLDATYQPSRRWRLVASLFNATNAAASDIDYYFVSRLPGEPLDGVADIHTHPAVPRTLRLSAVFTF
jgi:hypothetical protein